MDKMQLAEFKRLDIHGRWVSGAERFRYVAA
jgi:hypothetical protein